MIVVFRIKKPSLTVDVADELAALVSDDLSIVDQCQRVDVDNR